MLLHNSLTNSHSTFLNSSPSTVHDSKTIILHWLLSDSSCGCIVSPSISRCQSSLYCVHLHWFPLKLCLLELSGFYNFAKCVKQAGPAQWCPNNAIISGNYSCSKQICMNNRLVNNLNSDQLLASLLSRTEWCRQPTWTRFPPQR